MTAELPADAARFLDNLDGLGVPTFTAAPGGAGGSEFLGRPTGWADLNPAGNTQRRARWQPGHALCGVMGGRVAGLDCDPRNGGDPAELRRALAELSIRIYAEVATPGDGAHLYTAGHPDLASALKLEGWPGIEVHSYGTCMYLPGTQRPKYAGRGYVIVLDDLGALLDGDDDSAGALLDWVDRHRPGTRETFTVAVPWDGTPPDTRQRAYLDAVVRNQAADLAAMAPDSWRNVALYTAALKLGSYVAGAGLAEHDVHVALVKASNHNGLITEDGARSVAATIRSGLSNGMRNPRAVPPASEVTDMGPAPAQAGAQGSLSARRVRLTAASTITPKPVRWLWTDRIPIGEVTLTPGRGGIGKSTFHAWLAARVTRGELPGEHHGTSKPVIIASFEDSWARTIVPRLMAAGADLTLVHRVDIITIAEGETTIRLPSDVAALGDEIEKIGVALVSVDPLLSAVDTGLDSYKARDVRASLEPLSKLADRTGCVIVGNAHYTKGGTDPLLAILGSGAFGHVVRAVLAFAKDTDSGECVISIAKNNLGRDDLPSLAYRIESHTITTPEGPADVGRLVMLGESSRSVHDIMRDHGDGGDRTERDEAADWLRDYLVSKGGEAPRVDVLKAAKGAGFTEITLKRARDKVPVYADRRGFPSTSVWTLDKPSATVTVLSSRVQSAHHAKGEPTDPTGDPTGQTGQPVDGVDDLPDPPDDDLPPLPEGFTP
jgi:hypothetical protein